MQCDYTKAWKQKVPDSDQFEDRLKLNRDKPYKDEFFSSDRPVKLGHFTINTSDVIALGWTYGRSQYKEMFKYSEFVPPNDRDGKWTFDAEN